LEFNIPWIEISHHNSRRGINISKGCESKEVMKRNVQQAILEEGIEAEVSFREVAQEEAEQLGMGGSPTIWINGRDLEPGTPPAGIS